MKKRYSEEQIVKILKEVESGGGIGEVCRKYNVSESAYYRWRDKYGGLEVSDVKRMKELETENLKLKRIVADQALDIQMLRDITTKKF